MKNDYPLEEVEGEIIQIDGKPLVDVKKMPLDEWLNSLGDKNFYIPDWHFPTDQHKDEYISKIHDYSEKEFKKLLRHFLIESGSFPGDISGVMFRLECRPDLKLEFDRKILSGKNPWEGIMWTLDLLPDDPESTLKVMRSYFFIHAQQLPDGRLVGLSHAMSLIRARYLKSPQTEDEIYEMFLKISPRDFEALIARLYKEMGYTTQLTQYSQDDGADIICYRDDPGRRELLVVQCKRYAKNVGLKHVKELLGAVTDRKATKGVLITPGEFTRPAIQKADDNPQIELLGSSALQSLFVQHLGARWVIYLDRLIIEGNRC